MFRLPLLALALSSAALASPRLLPEVPALNLLPPEVVRASPPTQELLAVGAAAALFATPAALLLGNWVGTWSNDLYAAVIPVALILLFVPPLAVVLSEWMYGEREGGGGRFRRLPALGVALLAQLGLLAGAFFLGINAAFAPGAALFTLAEVLVLPTITTAMLRWTERPPTPALPAVAAVTVFSRSF